MGMNEMEEEVIGILIFFSRKKLKTREGEAIRLRDLLKEGIDRSMEKLKEKGRHEVSILSFIFLTIDFCSSIS